ncbi:MAG: M48 family metallopeptidase, partial [Spirochaetia bacterium]|nr:M48 family metallopeptidase [Spirochaetia bacterium]
AALVAGLYFVLPKFEKKWDPEKLTSDMEKRFGDLIEEQIRNDATFVESKTVNQALKTIQDRLLSTETNIGFPVRILVVRNTAVNAFTFPGGLVIIHTGLLAKSESPEEVAGVLAHEFGHIAHRDSLKALYRQVGLSIIVNVVTGGRSDQVQDLITQLLGIRFTRIQEGEADDYAIDLMIRSGINPEALARFFEKLKKESSSLDEVTKFLDSHPDTEGRMKKARAAGKKFDPKKARPFALDWARVKKKLPSVLAE